MVENREIRFPHIPDDKRVRQDVSKITGLKRIIEDELKDKILEYIEELRLSLLERVHAIHKEGMSDAATAEVMDFLDRETGKWRKKLVKE